MPVRSVLYIQAKPGMQHHLIETFERIDVPGNAMKQDGCLSVELHKPEDPEAPILVTALWRDRAGYQGWLDNPWRAWSTGEIAPYIADEPAAGAVYEVVLAAGDPSAIAAGARTTGSDGGAA